ncbi:hypothetical protein V6N11_077220 [Hibiscus sabdariffa]|uniref:Uncharacterized protein n=1 Tax=Hibiscus sabdariffa TaxID=183260 RepID=A0ABR2TCF0_9ROSI
MSGNPSEAVPALFGGSGGRPPDSRAPSVGLLPTGHEGTPIVGRLMGESLSQDQSDGKENSVDIDCNSAGYETMEVQQTVVVSAHEEGVEKLMSTQGAKGKETYASMVSKGTGSAGVSSSVGIEPQVSNTMEDTSPNVDKGSELFGPWMVAESRWRRNVSLNRNGHKTDNTVSVAGGSRFATLSDMGGEDTVPTVVGKVQPKEVRKSAAYMKSNPDKKKKGVSQPIETSRVVSLVDDKEPEVVATESAQGVGLHMAVSIVERYDGSKPPAGGKMVKARGHGNKGTNEGIRRGFSLRKPAELRLGATQNLAAWVQGMSQQLSMVEQSSGVLTPTIGITVDPQLVGEQKEQHIKPLAVDQTDCMDNVLIAGDGIDTRSH